MKCPICGATICAVDTLESEWELGIYYDTVEGTCPDCGNSWQWIEVYTFDHIEDIIGPINLDDHL